MSMISYSNSKPSSIKNDADAIQQVINGIQKLYEHTEHSEHIHQNWPRLAIEALKGEFSALPADKEKEVCELASQLLFKSGEFVGKAKYFHEESERNNSIEVTKQHLLRKSKERDKWMAWIFGMVRWIAGSIVALLMYSFAVYLAGAYEFLHLPLHNKVLTNQTSSLG